MTKCRRGAKGLRRGGDILVGATGGAFGALPASVRVMTKCRRGSKRLSRARYILVRPTEVTLRVLTSSASSRTVAKARVSELPERPAAIWPARARVSGAGLRASGALVVSRVVPA